MGSEIYIFSIADITKKSKNFLIILELFYKNKIERKIEQYIFVLFRIQLSQIFVIMVCTIAKI